MKKFAFVLFCIAGFLQASAQVSGIGLRPVLTLSTYKLSKDVGDAYDASLRAGSGIAAFMEINLGNRFTVQPEVAFIQRGAYLKSESTISWNGSVFGYPADYTVVDHRLKETLNYVDVPIMFEKNFGGGQFGAYIAAGPTFSFAVGNGRGVEETTVEFNSGENGTGSETDRLEYSIEMGKGRYDDYKAYDLSANAGAGIIYIMERGELALDLRYSHGLRALDAEGLKNRSFQIGLSYMHYLGQ